MNGAARPCENPTTNTAMLLSDYAFRQEYVLAPISGESFSVGLRRGALRATRLFVTLASLATLLFAAF